jgi:hypothetical protein
MPARSKLAITLSTRRFGTADDVFFSRIVDNVTAGVLLFKIPSIVTSPVILAAFAAGTRAAKILAAVQFTMSNSMIV